MGEEHPVRFSVEYPDRPLNRVSTAFRCPRGDWQYS